MYSGAALEGLPMCFMHLHCIPQLKLIPKSLFLKEEGSRLSQSVISKS